MRFVSLACGCVVSAIGLLSFVGWVLGANALQDLFRSGVTMKTNAAIAGTSAGFSLLTLSSSRRPVQLAGKLLAVLTFSIAFVTLMEHVTRRDFGIDQLLFSEPPGRTATV